MLAIQARAGGFRTNPTVDSDLRQSIGMRCIGVLQVPALDKHCTFQTRYNGHSVALNSRIDHTNLFDLK